jgi:hypothetical protein
MSDDPTRPIRPGWPSQPDPRSTPQRGQETRRDWGAPGGQPGQSGWGDQSGQGYGQGQGGRRDWGAQRDPRGQDDPRAQGDWGQPGNWDGRSDGRAARPRRRHRGLTITAVVVVVLLVLLVVADRVAASLAENEAASQIKSAGFPVKPKVDIEGFPFLTQLAARDFHKVDITASNVKEGPLTIASIDATGQGVHLTSSFNGATVDQINGTALVTFAGLSSAGGLGDGIKLSDAGNNELKASVDLGFTTLDATAQVTRANSHQIEVRVTNAGPIPQSALGNLTDFKVSLPSLPAGMSIQSVSVTSQGVLISISGSHTSFGG